MLYVLSLSFINHFKNDIHLFMRQITESLVKNLENLKPKSTVMNIRISQIDRALYSFTGATNSVENTKIILKLSNTT